MDVILVLLIGIPVAGVVAAWVMVQRREARDRRLRNRPTVAGQADHLDGNINAKAAVNAAFISRGGNSLPF